MKKMLTLLSAITMTVTASSTVISCNYKQVNDNKFTGPADVWNEYLFEISGKVINVNKNEKIKNILNLKYLINKIGIEIPNVISKEDLKNLNEVYKNNIEIQINEEKIDVNKKLSDYTNVITSDYSVEVKLNPISDEELTFDKLDNSWLYIKLI